MTSRRARTTIADDETAEPERRRGETAAAPPGVAQLLALQRSAGNAAVGRLVGGRTLQRTPEDDKLVAFGESVTAVLDRIRKKPRRIAEVRDDLSGLVKRAATEGVAAGHAALRDMLQALLEIADGTRASDELPGILYASEQGQFDALAAATMSARTRGGRYDEPVMEQRLVAEETGHEDEDHGEVTARVNLVVQALEKAYAEHQRQVQGTPGRTIMVFLGGEWHFRHAAGPFSHEERDLAIEKCRALSALYPDVVLMPGTILSHKSKDKKQQFTGITNTAPVLWNGTILKLVDKAGDAGDSLGQAKGTYKGDKIGKGSFFELGELRFAIDICVDHYNERAKKEGAKKGKEADVHLVTAWGQLATPGKGAVGQHGYMIGADASGSGSNFIQEGTEGDIESVPLEVGAQHGKVSTGRNFRRILDYMPPQPIGAAVPDAAIADYRDPGLVLVPDAPVTVNVADQDGKLTPAKV